MGARGVLFAIDQQTVDDLRAASDDGARRDVVARVEEAWEASFTAETDKAWDAMHRALSDGSLNIDAGSAPLNRAILGGAHLHEADGYIIAFVPRDEVVAVAAALAAIDDDAMRQRYRELVPSDYDSSHGDEDREYVVASFRDVVAFYARAAEAGRAVIFTVDQ